MLPKSPSLEFLRTTIEEGPERPIYRFRVLEDASPIGFQKNDIRSLPVGFKMTSPDSVRKIVFRTHFVGAFLVSFPFHIALVPGPAPSGH